MLQMHVVLCIWKSLETVFLIAICRQSGTMASENPVCNVFDIRSSIVLTYLIIGNTFFSCINICRVPRKMFEHEANRPSLQTSPEGPGKC